MPKRILINIELILNPTCPKLVCINLLVHGLLIFMVLLGTMHHQIAPLQSAKNKSASYINYLFGNDNEQLIV